MHPSPKIRRQLAGINHDTALKRFMSVIDRAETSVNKVEATICSWPRPSFDDYNRIEKQHWSIRQADCSAIHGYQEFRAAATQVEITPHVHVSQTQSQTCIANSQTSVSNPKDVSQTVKHRFIPWLIRQEIPLATHGPWPRMILSGWVLPS